MDELVEDREDVGSGGAQHLVDLLHRDRLVAVAHARGGVDDEGDRGIPPRLGGQRDLGDARHAGDVGAREPGEADLGARLEARPLEAGVDPAVADRLTGGRRGLEDLAPDRRVVGLDDVGVHDALGPEPSKNVTGRCLVRSRKSSRQSRSPGRRSGSIDPVTLTATTSRTPRSASARTLAR